MPDEFYKGTDWEGSSGPIVSREFQLGDLWPVGAAMSKDELANGLHPVLAIGSKNNRPINLTGVVITYNANGTFAEINLADKVVVRNYVANVLTYGDGVPATFDTSMAIGEPVYVDDSTDLGMGVTLSRSPLNENNQPNPLAGYLFYCQDEYVNYAIGGPNSAAVWPKTLHEHLEQDIYCIILVNDYGNAEYAPV